MILKRINRKIYSSGISCETFIKFELEVTEQCPAQHNTVQNFPKQLFLANVKLFYFRCEEECSVLFGNYFIPISYRANQNENVIDLPQLFGLTLSIVFFFFLPDKSGQFG